LFLFLLLSGGVFDHETCLHYLVCNHPPMLLEYSDRGTAAERGVRRAIMLADFDDTEGVCWYRDKIAIVEERRHTILLCGIPVGGDAEYVVLSRCDCEEIDPGIPEGQFSSDGNLGFEGIACDGERGRFYVVQEKDPPRVITIDHETRAYEDTFLLAATPGWSELIAGNDLAGIHYDLAEDVLYVLSEEAQVAIKSRLDGTILGVFDISGGGQPEGLYFTNQMELFVTSEPNELLRFLPVKVVPSPTVSPTEMEPTPQPNEVEPTSQPTDLPVSTTLGPSVIPSLAPSMQESSSRPTSKLRSHDWCFWSFSVALFVMWPYYGV
jgi:uncharacterized protein YjiK